MMQTINIHAAMEALRLKRPIFHSEKDFQFAIALELQRAYPDANIRLERPFPMERAVHIDILIQWNGLWFPIELKYEKRPLKITVDGEDYRLPGGAHDIDMYDCVKDIYRLEHLIQTHDAFGTGYALWLSNDMAYWDTSYQATYYKAFHAPHGATLTGELTYERPPKGNLKGYDVPLRLHGNYPITWNDYSSLEGRNGSFKYALIEVTKQPIRPTHDQV